MKFNMIYQSLYSQAPTSPYAYNSFKNLHQLRPTIPKTSLKSLNILQRIKNKYIIILEILRESPGREETGGVEATFSSTGILQDQPHHLYGGMFTCLFKDKNLISKMN